MTASEQNTEFPLKPGVLALDIGGVCIRLHPERCFGRLGYRSITEVPQEFLAAVDRMETGNLTEHEFASIFRKVTGNALPESVLSELWCATLGEPMPGMAALVRDMKKAGFHPVFFSDTSILHIRYFRERFPIAEFVPDGIYSFVAGAKKPQPAMFAAFEADYGKPVLYVDDRAICLEGAKAFHWRTHQFKDADTLRELLGL